MGDRPAQRRRSSAAESARDSVVGEGLSSRRSPGRESPVTCDVDLRRPPVSLTAKDVAQITRLLEESSFDELYLELDGLKLSLRRGSAANVQSVADAASADAPQ